MRAGELRHRVVVERPTKTKNPNTGAVVEVWATFADNVPAAIYSISGREFIQSDATQAENTRRIVMRQLPGINEAMRIRHPADGDRLYNITAIMPDATLKRGISLVCSTGVNAGT